mgnify:CR=1 FL=1
MYTDNVAFLNIGMSYLEKLFHVLAEMYKFMGLWVLALGIYLDAGDMVVSLLGYDDDHAVCALGYVTSCLRKMHLPVLAESYVDSVRIQIEATSRNPVKAAMGRKLIDADRYLLLILRYMSTIILTCIC